VQHYTFRNGRVE